MRRRDTGGVDKICGEDVRAMQRAISNGDLCGACAVAESIARRTLGLRFFSVSRVNGGRATVERIYSSDIENFPKGALKSTLGAPWKAPLLDRCEVLIMETPEALAEIYAEAGILSDLGLGGGINAPIEIAGECVGTINLFGEAHCYRRDQEPTARAIADLLAPAFAALNRPAEV